MTKLLSAALFLGLFSAAALADSDLVTGADSELVVGAGSDLLVEVAGVNSSEGNIRLALYDRDKGFTREKYAITAQEAKASTEPVVITIADVPAGDYAIHAFHDANGNRSFDHMLGLFPAEGYGFSVNSDVRAEESFENSRFSHDGVSPTAVTVYMRYCGSREHRSAGKTLSCWISFSP